MDGQPGMARCDLIAALALAMGATGVSPERPDAINNGTQPSQDPLQIIIFDKLRREL